MLSTKTLRPVSATVRQGIASQRLFHASRPTLVVHNIKTAEEFNKVIKEQKRVIVDCFAIWCGPCRLISPVLEKASELPGFKENIYFAKVDVDEVPNLSEKLRIRAMPTFIFFKDGNRVDEIIGANQSALMQSLKKLND